MRKLILFLLLITFASITFAQEIPPPSQYLKAVNGQFFMDTRDSSVWQFMGSAFGWQKKARFKDVVPFDPRFTSDMTVYLPSGYTFGKYVNGSTIPSTGKTAAQVIADAIVVAIPPSYVQPSAAISGVPAPGTYEIGTIFSAANSNQLTFSSTFNQGNAGSLTGTTYYQNGSALSGNTAASLTLTTTNTFYVQKAYLQGACIANNLGTIDCTGRINAGTVNSSTITYTPAPKRYAVWLSDTTGIKTIAFNDALITAATLVNQISSSKSFSFSTGAVTGKFLAIVYVSTAGALNSISINGVGSIGAFNNVTRNFTNQQGYAQAYRIYYNTQAQTTSGYDIITN